LVLVWGVGVGGCWGWGVVVGASGAGGGPKALQIVEGTNQIQRLVIGRDLARAPAPVR
jgi:hypothetical protein